MADTHAVLNVPAGSYNLRAYAAGKQYAPISATVEAGATVEGADFAAPAGATATAPDLTAVPSGIRALLGLPGA